MTRDVAPTPDDGWGPSLEDIANGYPISPTPAEGGERQAYPLTEPMRHALMREHSNDWDMETVAEAAYICSEVAAIPPKPASEQPDMGEVGTLIGDLLHCQKWLMLA